MKKRILIAALAACVLLSFSGCTQDHSFEEQTLSQQEVVSGQEQESVYSVNTDTTYSYYAEIEEEMSPKDVAILQSIQPQVHGENSGMTPTTDTPYRADQLSKLQEGMTYDEFRSILGDNGRDGNYTYDVAYSPIDVNWVDSNGTILFTSFESGVCTYLDIIDRSVE